MVQTSLDSNGLSKLYMPKKAKATLFAKCW